MIITRTPLRISFVGGGSDCPWFYEQQLGAVVSATINKYIYISVNDSFDNKYRLHYSKFEEVTKAGDIKNELIKTILDYHEIKPLEISSMADLPSKTGLGSSSSYAVGLIRALYPTMVKENIANRACQIEIEQMKKPVGKQDQYAATFGGLNYIRFIGENVDIEPIELPPELEQNLILFYTGKSRKAETIHQDITEHITEEKIEITKQLAKLAVILKNRIKIADSRAFPSILHEGWMLKKRMSKLVSDDQIDGWYDSAISAGALGGKLLGAGGGGFLLFYVPREYQENVKRMLPLQQIDFKFENKGTEIIYEDRNHSWRI